MKLHSIRFKAMGSPCELQLYMKDNEASHIGQSVISFIKKLEEKYSRYRSDSVTSQINAAAGTTKAIKLDEETATLINYANVLYEQSDGLFDITSGVLRNAWNFNETHLPAPEKIASLLPNIGWQKVEWRPPYFRLPIANMEIDFGGFVKEYAADAAAQLCVDLGVNHGLVNLGGDIHVMGPHPDGSPWQVGIQHPRKPQQAIASIEIAQGAIATSGDYERFMIVDEKRYSHLLNPFTGESIQPLYASASVIAPQCIIAGSFTTIALLKSNTSPHWLTQAGLPYLLIDQRMQMAGTLATTLATH